MTFSAPVSDQPEITRQHKAILVMEHVSKVYQMESVEVRALDNISFTIREGEYVAIMGKSGSGKSTLLNLIGCLDRPTSGTYRLGEHFVANLSDNELSRVRCQSIGFIFQSFNLIKQLNVLENIQLPLFYLHEDPRKAQERALSLAQMVGLGERIDHRPNELSGGQRQRVAIARALANNPIILLADEPTGNLDSQSEAEILDIFRQLHAEGKTLVVVTHDDAVAHQAQRIIRLHDGKIVEDTNP
ncbi:MAG: ABC transporter ATP-binding protein [Lentisphaerae bacterium]|nr:MAG: ABC transporter ATP-binding protein [Lentisphaerota bacterium]